MTAAHLRGPVVVVPMQRGCTNKIQFATRAEADAKPWHMCGAQSQEGYSWCPAHKARVFISRADAA